MQIEDRLDALLTAHFNGMPVDTWTPVDHELMPLFQAVDALAPLRDAQPRAEFAWALERRLLAYAATSSTKHGEMAARAGDTPGDVLTDAPSAETNASPSLNERRGLRSGRGWHPWQLIAAAVLLLIIGTSALTVAAAAAGPDSPLFGLHRAEQNIRVQLASSQGDRVHLHLNYASEALAQLNSAVAQQSGDPAFSVALATFLTEQRAAADGLAQLPPGHERDALTRQLADLRAKARADLHAALHTLSWTERLTTTQALGELGEPILSVQDAKITHINGQNEHLVQLVVSGNGFAPGATVIIDGQQAGTTTSASATQLVVDIDTTTTHLPLRAIGVSNPDGTAALSPRIEQDTGANQSGGNTGHPTPVVHPTPTPRDGHGHGNG